MSGRLEEGLVYRVYTVWELRLPAILPAAPGPEQFFQLLLLVPVTGSCSDNHSSCCHVLLTLHWTFISPAATMPYDVEEEVKKTI